MDGILLTPDIGSICLFHLVISDKINNGAERSNKNTMGFPLSSLGCYAQIRRSIYVTNACALSGGNIAMTRYFSIEKITEENNILAILTQHHDQIITRQEMVSTAAVNISRDKPATNCPYRNQCMHQPNITAGWPKIIWIQNLQKSLDLESYLLSTPSHKMSQYCPGYTL